MVDCFLLPKIKKCSSTDVFLGVFSDFSEQLSSTSEQLLRRTKTFTIALPDNFRSSHQEVFFEIADPKYLRKVPGKASFMKCFVSYFLKIYSFTDFFLGIFSKFPEQLL